MSLFTPADPNFTQRIRTDFAAQPMMRTIGATLTEVQPGAISICLSFRDDLCQQHGFLHGGIVTAIVDSACGFAALTLMPAHAEVLTVEFKVNFLRPAVGVQFLASGQVTKPGRTLTVCAGTVLATQTDGSQREIVSMLATMIAKIQ